jgi:hypothetical protein
MQSIDSRDVPEKHIASTFSVEKKAKEETSLKQVASRTSFMLVSCLAYFSNLKMEATCSSETSVDFQRTTRRYVPEDKALGMQSSWWNENWQRRPKYLEKIRPSASSSTINPKCSDLKLNTGARSVEAGG